MSQDAETQSWTGDVPLLPVGWIARPRLDAVLDRLWNPGDPASPRLAVVCAPAGFGKTTLASAWAHHTARHTLVTWTSLDAESDPIRSLDELLSTTSATGRDQSPNIDAHPRVVIIDDVHEVRDPALLDVLDRLIRRLPSTLRLVLVGRFEPFLPSLVRRRLEGAVIEVRADELAFSAAEVADLLDPAIASHATAVFEQTVGWPAGVRLAEMALREQPERALPGFPLEGAVAGYLFGEAFLRQQPIVQEVLLAASVPEAVTTELAALVSSRRDAGTILHSVAATCALLTEVWDPHHAQHRYTFHPLLRAYLAAQAMLRNPSAVAARHGTTARWSLGQGDRMAAVHHAACSGDAELLNDVLDRAGPSLIVDGRGAQLDNRLADWSSPPTAWGPLLRAVHAIQTMDIDHAQALIDQTMHRPDPETTRLIRARQLICAVLANDDNDPDGHEQLDGDLAGLATVLAVAHGTLRLRNGPWQDATETLHWASARTHELGLLGPAQAAAVGMAVAELAAGRLGEVHRWALKACAGPAATPTLVDDLLTHCASRRLLNEPHRRTAPHAAADPFPDVSRTLAFHLRVDVTNTASDDEPKTANSLGRWLTPQAEADGYGTTQVSLAAFGTAAVRWALSRHRRDIVGDIRQRCAAIEADSPLITLIDAWDSADSGAVHRTRARVVPLLDRDDLTAREKQEVWLLRASCALRSSQPHEAVLALRQALAAADVTGDLRLFLEAGPQVVVALQEHRAQFHPHDKAVARILSAAAPMRPRTPATLTGREREMLTELATIDSLQDIADTLHLSVNTVKTHVKGIYRKLDVTSRREAVREAHAVGLL